MTIAYYSGRDAIEPEMGVLISVMRPQDRAEAEAFVGDTIHNAMLWLLDSQVDIHLAIASPSGEPLCLFGCQELSDDSPRSIGSPWMVSFNAIERNRIEVVREAREQLLRWQANHDVLFNWVHAANKGAVEWLDHLGFTIEEPVPYGARDELFHHFHWEKKSV